MSYHITQEQAAQIAVENFNCSAILHIPSKVLQAYANAVLDKVLGEPVGETQSNDGLSYALFENASLPAGTKLYAPKELP